MNSKTTDNLKEESTWLRLVFIILFAILLHIAEFVIGVMVVIQFLSKLFTGKVMEQGTVLGQDLSTYVYEIIRFLTFSTDEMPWPMNPWPNGPPPAGPASGGDAATEVAPAAAEGAPAKPKPTAAKKAGAKKAGAKKKPKKSG